MEFSQGPRLAINQVSPPIIGILIPALTPLLPPGRTPPHAPTKTTKPLRDWFWAIFLVATRTTGPSAAWSWCHKIRKAMQGRDNHYILRGAVELDDSYTGGKRGRGAKSKVVVERKPKGCGHVSLQKVDGPSTCQGVSKDREMVPIVLRDLRRAVEVFPGVHRVKTISHRLINACCSTPTITYKQLVAELN